MAMKNIDKKLKPAPRAALTTLAIVGLIVGIIFTVALVITLVVVSLMPLNGWGQ